MDEWIVVSMAAASTLVGLFMIFRILEHTRGSD